MDEALRARLLGQIAETPVDWVLNAQIAAMPRIVLQRISGGAEYTMSGPSGLCWARVQVDCYAGTVAAAKVLGRAVKTALSGWYGGTIRGAFLESERDLSTDTGGGETVARVSLDFMIHYKEF